MNPWEISTNIVLLAAFLFFNYSFWSGQWSKSENESQGLLEWCFNADGNKCCQSVSDHEIITQVWFKHFQKSVSGAWVFIVLTLIIAPYCVVIHWNERKTIALVLLSLACFSSAVCLMVAVCVYGSNFKSTISLKHHNLHSSFGIAIICLLLYIFAGISTTVYIFKRKKPMSNYCDFKKIWTGDHAERNLQVVTLDKSCYEYKAVAQSFKLNNENFEIIQIQRIENKRLYDAHISFKKHFMDIAQLKYPATYKQYLWHGTSKESSTNINQAGFNRNYQGKNACFYGDGVYFATEPSYSSSDTFSVPDRNGDKFVYKCSVFVGRFGQGKQDLKEPPRDINNIRYDSTVDDVNDPKIHVVFHDNQAYPEYLIKFHHSNRARY